MTATLFPISASDVAMTTDEWYTPRWLFDAAGLVFDLDVCAPVAPELRTCPARRFLTVVEDGLTSPWEGLVWMNPPYSNPGPWVDRWAAHPDGMALLPAANSAWRERVLAGTDALTLVGTANYGGFWRCDGTITSFPHALILAGRGAGVTGIERLVAQGIGGAWFVQGGGKMRKPGPGEA